MSSFSIHKFFQLAAAFCFFALLTSFAGSGWAQPVPSSTKEAPPENVAPPIFLELYTSEDCAACIYADHMLYESMKNDRVIALSCVIQDMAGFRSVEEKHADSPENDAGAFDQCLFRQWAYQSSRSEGTTTLSIPMFIMNGFDILVAANMNDFKNTLSSYKTPPKNIALGIFMEWKDQDTVTIHLPQAPDIEKANTNASVWIIRYEDVSVRHIETGENKGKVLRFSNVVKDVRHIAKWHGALRSINVDVHPPEGGKSKGGYAVMVSAMVGSPILAAGKLSDYAVPGAAPTPAKTQ